VRNLFTKGEGRGGERGGIGGERKRKGKKGCVRGGENEEEKEGGDRGFSKGELSSLSLYNLLP
jgi:hypothetical protein